MLPPSCAAWTLPAVLVAGADLAGGPG